MAGAEDSRNSSGNRPFGGILEERLSRRAVVGRGLAAAGMTAFLGSNPAAATRRAEAGATGRPGRPVRPSNLLGFDPVPTSDEDTLTVPEGYTTQILIPWGQPLLSTGPAWKKDASNTAADQAQQIGQHHDGMHYFPKGSGQEKNRRGLLVVNHEYIDRNLTYTDGDEVMTAEKVAKALEGHGVSIVEIELVDGRWRTVDSSANRRITGTTPMAFSGPVTADHPELQAELGNEPTGTLNNCAHGVTPWGTYLTCEENFHGYFGTEDAAWEPTEHEDRYGFSTEGLGYRWHLADERFDLARNRREANRFGWIVEINPFDPDSVPVKRTALGRFRSESATYAESQGRSVLYMGDDADGEYLYKFVSKRPWTSYSQGASPLDDGVLYVAKFEDDGTATWLPLEFGEGPLTAAEGWQDQADVLIRSRQAADAVGATPLDRPEWVAVRPETEDVFVTFTNGSSGPRGPNPRSPNPYGHIVKLVPDGRDHTRTTFRWDIWVLAGDPAYDGRVELDDTNIFGSPDGLWVDPDGRLWIRTDISNSSQNQAGAGYDNIANNAMLAAAPETGEIRRFLVGPRGAEITGVITTPDQTTMFVNIQHPGESTDAWGTPTPENPRAVSNWPDYAAAGRARSATVVIRKEDGGKIGA